MKWWSALWLFFSISANASCVVTDDAGRDIKLKKPAQRIISLAPDLTETLFAINAGERIVGVISGSDYPAAAKKIVQVGSYTGIDLERVIALHPDLIVTWSNTFSRSLSTLQKFNIPIYMAQPKRLEDIPRTMKNLGCLTGENQISAQAASTFTQRLELLKQKYSQQKPVTVFYQIGSYSLITINKNSWINQAIEICGGRNIFAAANIIAPEVGWEAVVTANPQVIISDATQGDWRKRWQAWPSIWAVKEQKMFSVNPDLIERAGPRILDGASQVCEYLQKTRARY